MSKTAAFAEVVQSSLQTFTGQCWQWDTIPHFGSLVAIEHKQRTFFGIVYEIQTGSMDPTRYPFAYQKTHEELQVEQPQIFEFLKTTFSCVALGYKENNTIQYLMPPEPPPIHSFVMPLQPDLIPLYCASNNYLHLLFSASNSINTIDELLLALVKQRHCVHPFTDQELHEFITYFSLLIGNDYRRLRLFLSRVQRILAHN